MAGNLLEDSKELKMDPVELFKMEYALLYKYMKSHKTIHVELKKAIADNPGVNRLDIFHRLVMELASRFNKMK